MKLKISDKMKAKISAMAVQTVVQARFSKLVSDRAVEIEAELDLLDEELSPDEIIAKYMDLPTGIAVPQLLVPKH
jgi:hypothetical protein